MIRINLLTGTAWTKSIEVEGTLQSDIIGLLDDYFYTHGVEGFPVALYNDVTDDEMDIYIPINGGQYWIEGIASIEEI